MNFLRKAILSFGGLGYGPIAPGTWGSAGAAAIYALLRITWTDDLATLGIVCIAFAAVFFILTAAFGGWAEKVCGEKDPGMVVSDEVAGYFISAVYVVNGPWWLAAGAAFVFFRIFDIAKVWPANAVEKAKGGIGIALDDVIAGVYACAAANLAMLAYATWFKGA
jgi:phosphatidylglycerophosphatase A